MENYIWNGNSAAFWIKKDFFWQQMKGFTSLKLKLIHQTIEYMIFYVLKEEKLNVFVGSIYLFMFMLKRISYAS